MEDFQEDIQTAVLDAPEVETDEKERVEEIWHYTDGDSLLGSGLTIELHNVKSALVIAPCHGIPICAEGLLLEHHRLPMGAEFEVVLSADDRDIVRERFFLPSNHREELISAHRELVTISPDFLTDSRLRDKAMSVYFPELSLEYDLWYRLSVDEHGTLDYSIHIGPSHFQEIKKKIEGRISL